MKNSDLLWEELFDRPTDTTLKLALVDALLDEGDWQSAETVRWCVDNGRWPTDGTKE